MNDKKIEETWANAVERAQQATKDALAELFDEYPINKKIRDGQDNGE